MKILFVILFVLSGAGILAYAMGRPPRYHPGGPYYYKWFMTYQGERPSGEISKAEAEELGRKGYAYYIVYFDDQGKLRSATKYEHGQVAWEKHYDRPAILTSEEAIAIARQATSQMKIPADAMVSCVQDQYLFVVTFKIPNPPKTLGADYYAQVHIDGLSRKVIKLLVAP